MPQQRHVVDRVRAGDHPRDQRGHLQPRVRALVGRHAQVPSGPALRARPARPTPSPGPAPPTPPDSDHRTPPRSGQECERVASQRCPSESWLIGTVASPNLPARKGILALRHAHTTIKQPTHRWIRAKPSCGFSAVTSRMTLRHWQRGFRGPFGQRRNGANLRRPYRFAEQGVE